MNISTANGKTITAVNQSEFESLVGFAITDYVTLALGVKRLYALGCDAALVTFDGELFACEQFNITPLGNAGVLEIPKLKSWDGSQKISDFCLKLIGENS